MMAQDEAKCTREPIKYGKFINEFHQDIITSTQQYEWMNTNICRQKMSIWFNQICLNADILPKQIDR